MSYSEENGQVVLRMSRDDYEHLMNCVFFALSLKRKPLLQEIVELEMGGMLNRLNEGNPNYTPYQVPEKK